MAIRGQRFQLDLDAENWQFNVEGQDDDTEPPVDVIKEVKERETSDVPPAPSVKTNTSKTGFPEHRRRPKSAFKLQQQATKGITPQQPVYQPSDRAIIHHAVKKRGIDLGAGKEKADISAENEQRINHMSLDEIEEARADLMKQFNPESLRKLLQRANVDEDKTQEEDFDKHEASRPVDPTKKTVAFVEPEPQEEDTTAKNPDGQQEHRTSTNPDRTEDLPAQNQPAPDMHFPAPPRNKDDYKPLDPSSATFLTELREHYFPDLPHDANALSWLQDPTPEEDAQSTYNPDRTGFAPSAIRFSFTGTIITPGESLEIPTTKGLHHHGDAPSSAGYTIPELALLCRSTLPNQRCVAYQILGRILFRLGRGDFGPRGSDLVEGLWTCIERERPVEVMMAEANRDEAKGRVHMSAKVYATEALWLWRRGGGGDRGVLKESQMRAQ